MNTELLIVGKYEISQLDNGDYWIRTEGGEGMQVSKRNFEKLIDEFYKKEF